MDMTTKVVATLDGSLAGRQARQALQVHIDALYDQLHAHDGRRARSYGWMFEQFDRIVDELASDGAALCNCGLGEPGFHEPLDDPHCALHASYQTGLRPSEPITRVYNEI